MQYYFWLGLLFFVCNQQLCAQKDSVVLTKETHHSFLSKAILPSTFILSGVLLTGSQTEKNWQRDVRNKVGNDYHNGMDDYIQYVPYVQIYLGDIVGIKAKNHWFDQTKNIVISNLVAGVLTHSLKRVVGKERPDLSNHHSFPSGHTGTAFTGAAILYQEYKESSMVYASSGFLFSTATGSLRVMNNKHWTSDVLVGAGLSMLVVNAVYFFEPLKNWNPFIKSKNVSFIPMINNNEITLVAALKF